MDVGNITFGFVEGTAAVKLGTYGQAEGSAQDLGKTIGGISFTLDRDVKNIETDQDPGPIAARETMRSGKVKFKLAESSLTNMALAMNLPTTAVAAGVLSGGIPSGGEIYRTVYLNVDGPAGGTRKYVLHKCVVVGAAQTEFKKDEPSSIEFEMSILWDTTQAAGKEMFTVTDTSADTTAPTIALSTPADGGTVTKNTAGTVVWTFTETNQLDQSTIVYGRTVLILNTTVAASTALVAGSIAYDATAKTITFTPTSNWTASDTMQAIVTTGVKDVNGNAIAAAKIEQFSVTV